MRKIVLLLLVLAILCSGNSVSFAVILGSTGAQVLGIGPGARISGMGEAFSAVADDPSAILWNPGGLALMNGKEIMFTQNYWLMDTRYQFAGGVLPYGTAALGFSYAMLDAGEFLWRDNNGANVGEGSYDAKATVMSICFSEKLSDNFSFGLNGKILNQSIEEETAVSYHLDAGLMFRLSPNVNLALVVQNAGQEVKFINEGDPSPMNIIGGTAIKIPMGVNQQYFTLACDVNYMYDEISINTGGEIRIGNFALRTGYQLNPGLISFGGGINLENLGPVQKVMVDFVFMQYGPLGDTKRISVGMKF